MTYTPTTPPETQAEPTKSTFSWKPPENYVPKRDYYADLVMSYSAMTDIIDPKSIACEFADIRILDSCLLEQAVRLHELTHKMLDRTVRSDGRIEEKDLLNALKVQHAFRESYRNANTVMTTRYIASTRPL
jgi:hypothetical protein